MPLTLNAPSRGVPLGEKPAPGRDVDVGGKQRQIRVIAAVQRQFDDLLRVDDLAVFARIGFERRRRARHLNDCVTSPTCSVRSTRWRASTSTSMSAATAFEKPSLQRSRSKCPPGRA